MVLEVLSSVIEHQDNCLKERFFGRLGALQKSPDNVLLCLRRVLSLVELGSRPGKNRLWRRRQLMELMWWLVRVLSILPSIGSG